MSADPVIIDDGGSTRLRYFPTTGAGSDEMDSLLNVSGLQGSQHTFNIAFQFLTIVTIDRDTAQVTRSVAADSKNPLTSGDKIVIVSGSFKIQVDIGVRDTLLTSSASSGSELPVVNVKQTEEKRRYLVTPAPYIETVVVTIKGVTTTYNVKGNSYTQVHLSNPPNGAAAV